MAWKMRKLKAYLRPSLTTFCRNSFERTEKNRRRIRARDSFQFSAQCSSLQRYLEEISIYHIQGQWVGKIQKSPCSEAKVIFLIRARQRKQTASCSGHRRRRRGYPFWILNSTTPKNCVVVFIQHLGLQAREYQSSDPYILPPLQFLQVQT